MNEQSNQAPEQAVVSTILLNAVLSDDVSGSNISKLLERHAGYLQHQLVVMCDETFSADWDVYFIPDSDGIPTNVAVDAGVNLAPSSAKSAMQKFTAALRGIVLVEATGPTASKTLTMVLTSTKGPLINS